MGTSTPLIDRIQQRRKFGRIGPVSPVPIKDRMSPFQRRLMEKRSAPKLIDGAWVPDGDGGAA